MLMAVNRVGYAQKALVCLAVPDIQTQTSESGYLEQG